MEVHYHSIKEKVLKEEIEMQQIETDDQVTNLFTKGLNMVQGMRTIDEGSVKISSLAQ